MASQPTPDRKCHRPRRLNAHLASALPFVLIGHSKLFSRVNEWALRPFLNHVRSAGSLLLRHSRVSARPSADDAVYAAARHARS